MRTQCCQPPHGSTQCTDCPVTSPVYRTEPIPEPDGFEKWWADFRGVMGMQDTPRARDAARELFGHAEDLKRRKADDQPCS